MKENWQEEYWKEVNDNYPKMINIVNRMRCSWTNNEDILNQAILNVYNSFERRKKPFTGDTYLPYITMTAKNVILQVEQKEKKRGEVNIEEFLNPEDLEEYHNFIIEEENNYDEELLKKADALWPAVIKWVSDPQNVNPISAGLFKFRFLTNNSLAYISDKTGYSAPTILKRTREVLEMVKIQFKDFGKEDYN
jgi:hypothetical protein